VAYAAYGYLYGYYPPGQRWRPRRMLAVAHHLLLGHARLVRLLHETVREGAIGIAQHQIRTLPLDPDDRRDIRAADLVDQVINRHYMDPLFLGRYPPIIAEKFRRLLPAGHERDLETMQEPGDFLGLNYYQIQSYRYSRWAPWLPAKETPTPGAKKNPLGWEIDPDGLYWLLSRIDRDYGHPVVYVTENGYPTIENPGAGARSSGGHTSGDRDQRGRNSGGHPAGARSPGVLEDPERIAYLEAHVGAVTRAREAGARVKGYFVWSLMDNFEWTEGYRARFGLLRVDYPTQTRTWRRSAHWYRDRIRVGAPEAE
jgi:beta-glucosidase